MARLIIEDIDDNALSIMSETVQDTYGISIEEFIRRWFIVVLTEYATHPEESLDAIEAQSQIPIIKRAIERMARRTDDEIPRT